MAQGMLEDDVDQPGSVVVPVSDPAAQASINQRAVEFNAYWAKVHEEAEFELHHLGFQRLGRPRFTCPEIDPQALTNADLSEYSLMHARVVAWHNYAENTLAYCESMLISVRRQMEQLMPQLLIEYSKLNNPRTGRPYSVADRKALAENTPRYIELLRDKTKLEAQRELAESYAKGLGRNSALISRHIEIRKMDIESGRVTGNIPNRGNNPGMYQR